MNSIRVLIVDDHTLFRDGLHAILSNVTDMDVIGEAGTGAEAVAQAASLAPDVILMDISMPDLNGIEATQQVLAAKPGTGIIMLTMLEDNDSIFAAMCAGVYSQRGRQSRGTENDSGSRRWRSALWPRHCHPLVSVLPAFPKRGPPKRICLAFS